MRNGGSDPNLINVPTYEKAIIHLIGSSRNDDKRCCAHAQKQTKKEAPTVYFTKEITPQSLLQIYKALGVTPQGKVAVKISTGESEQTGYLRPDFIKPLIDETKGVIVECNTAYGGSRGTTADTCGP